MKLTTLTTLIAALAYCIPSQAQSYCIEACPGEDTRTMMNLSWASDNEGSFAQYRISGKKSWTTVPTISHFCTVFDSLYSKSADGKDIYEKARFNKCGAELSGLRSKTDYEYRIIDGKDTSGIHHFRTSGAKEWSACIISDFHLYTPAPGRQKAAMEMMSTIEKTAGPYDWVLHAGDIIAWGGSWSFWKQLYSHENFSRWMWAGVNGNHDNMSRKYQLTNEYFRNANHYPQNGYEGQEGVCYSFRYGDALFIMLNSEVMRSEEGLADAQKWVRETVNAAKDVKWKIVVEHYQWFFATNGKTSQYERWCDVFDELGINLAIAGNNHIYARTCPLYAGKEVPDGQGTVYLQTSSSDNERGQAAQKELSENTDKIRIHWTEGDNTVGGMRIDVNPKRLHLVMMDRTGKIIDEFSVLSKEEK